MNNPKEELVIKEEIVPVDIDGNAVGTKEKALEIAENLNITDADKLIYKEYEEEWQALPTHWVIATGGADYRIYDFNGEFMSVSIGDGRSEKNATISEKEAEDKAVQYIYDIYGDVDVDIDSCKLLRGTAFSIDGTIYKPSEDSTRTVKISLNGDGEFCHVSAKYDPFIILGICEAEEIALDYSRSKDVYAILQKAQEIDGDTVYTIILRNNERENVNRQDVKLLASDYSLVEFISDIGITNNEIKLGDEKIKEVAKKYISEFYPQYSDAKIEMIQRTYSEAFAYAKIPDSSKYVSVGIWADGSIKSIKIVDESEINQGDGSATMAEIKEVESHIDDMGYPVIYGKELEFVKKYPDPNFKDGVAYEFKYDADNVAVDNYPFVLQMIKDNEADRYYASNKAVEDSKKLSFLRGMIMQLINPKGFVAALPVATIYFPSIGIEQYEIIVYSLIFGLMCTIGVLCYTAIGHFFSKWITRPGVLRICNIAMGTLLFVLAFSIIWEYIVSIVMI